MKRSFYFLIFVSIFTISYGQKIHFYPVIEKNLNFAQKMGVNSDSTFQTLPSFRISKQITFKEYKSYLSSIEKDSTYSFYLSQLPNIDHQDNFTKNYLSSTKFDNDPVIGVSMDNACNFARWYTIRKGKGKYTYRLPAVFEWISMNEEKTAFSKRTSKSKREYHKTNNFQGILLDWTLNAFDESAYEFYERGEFPAGYFYIHSKFDPKVMKRKCVIGQSFRISLENPVDISKSFSYYADEGYSDVGFRLIELKGEDPLKKFTVEKPAKSDINLKSQPSKSLSNSVEIIEHHVKEISNRIVEYSTKNGQLDGSFLVFKMVNNQKVLMVKGEMKNNCRIGYWSIYDELENNKVLIERLYKSSSEFEQLVPIPSKNELISFVTNEMNPTPGFDEDGCKEYVFVKSADFIFGRRLFREILFEKNKLPADEIIESLKKSVLYKEITTYDFENFTGVLENNPFENFSGEIIGFRIKEDFFFDKNRKLSETRILGFAPVYIDSTRNDKKELCWFSYPQIRKNLVNLKVPNTNFNVDNLFLERNFFGEIYKTADKFDRKDQEDGRKEFDHMDIDLLLTEHQIWLYLEGFADEY